AALSEEIAPAATNSGSWPRSQRTARRLIDPATKRIQSERLLNVNLAFPRADCDEENTANQANAAHDRRKINPLLFGVLDFKRTKLGIFLFLVPVQAAPGKANDADDDQNNPDNPCRFHAFDPTVAGGRRSIAE